MKTYAPHPRRARGVAIVEFALVCLIFFTLVFGALDFARLLFVHNTLQEVTRRAAREMTVRWIDQQDEVKLLALFNSEKMPAGGEVSVDSIKIEFLDASGSVVTDFPTDPGDNLSACGDATRTTSCIYSVRVSIEENIQYSPMSYMFRLLNWTLPISTVTMHAESMGFET